MCLLTGDTPHMHKQLLAAAILAAAATGAFAQQLPTFAPEGVRPASVASASDHESPTLTREQFLKDAAQRFDEMDANKDGKVTPDERRAFRQSHLRHLRAHGGAHPGPAPHEGLRPPAGPGPQDGTQPQSPKR